VKLTPTIYLGFVDDWELSGNGSGDPRELQFRPMSELVRIYRAYGIRGSFNAEVMQQLAFRKFQDQNPGLKHLADEWDAAVQETFREGHDIQLHIHPQWSDAEYRNGEWNLTGDWSILNYPLNQARQMIASGKEYLENLLRPLDPRYRCVSFRSGSWCIAPSTYLLSLLAELGIVFDMSIVGGVRYQTRRINLDYTNCEEDFLPFYPLMTDARRVSNKVEPIICVPTNHFYGSRRQTLHHHLRKLVGGMKSRSTAAPAQEKTNRTIESYGHEWAQTRHSSIVRRVYEKGLVPYITGRHLISDLAQLDYPLMREMLASIRGRARASKLSDLPVILENHTKDIRDFSHIERFIAEVSKDPDVKCITLTELARELQQGKFHIKTAAPSGR
jgi:hypothetical protein